MTKIVHRARGSSRTVRLRRSTPAPRSGWIALGGAPELARAAKHPEPEPSARHDLRVLQALRRIMRATDMHSRQLGTRYGITTPQLVTLQYLSEHGPLTLRRLAEGVHLSASTLVGIVDRLESKEFLQRERDSQDRRQVFVKVTRKGQGFLKKAPSPLQERLATALSETSPRKQEQLAEALETIVEFMEAGDLDAAPVLHGGTLQPPE